MKTKTLFLCGIASLALAATGAMAASGKTDSAMPMTQPAAQTESTPPAPTGETVTKHNTRHHKHHAAASKSSNESAQEEEQTKSLNEQSLRKAEAATPATGQQAMPSAGAQPSGATPSGMTGMMPPADGQQPSSQPSQPATPSPAQPQSPQGGQGPYQ